MSEINKAMTTIEAKKLDTYLSSIYSIGDIYVDMRDLMELFVDKATFGTQTSSEHRNKVVQDSVEFLANISEKQPERVANVLETICAFLGFDQDSINDRYYGLVLLFKYCNDERYKKDIINKLKGQMNSKYGVANTKA